MASQLNEVLRAELSDAADVAARIARDIELQAVMLDVVGVCADTLNGGGRIFFAGNGGSAADAQHFAAELVGRFYRDRKALSAIALTTDTSALTAIGNDYGFDKVFARQIEANGRSGDVFVGISTSGRSVNVVLAAQKCRELGIKTVALVGAVEGELGASCDYCIKAPANTTPRVQEAHGLIGHALCSLIELSLAPCSKAGVKLA